MTTWVAELALGIAVRPSRDLPSMTPWHKSTGILPVVLVHDAANSSIACLEIPHAFARVTNFPHGLAARLHMMPRPQVLLSCPAEYAAMRVLADFGACGPSACGAAASGVGLFW